MQSITFFSFYHSVLNLQTIECQWRRWWWWWRRLRENWTWSVVRNTRTRHIGAKVEKVEMTSSQCLNRKNQNVLHFHNIWCSYANASRVDRKITFQNMYKMHTFFLCGRHIEEFVRYMYVAVATLRPSTLHMRTQCNVVGRDFFFFFRVSMMVTFDAYARLPCTMDVPLHIDNIWII